MYEGKHGGEYHEYTLVVNYFIGHDSNERESIKSEEVVGEESSTGASGSVGRTVKTRTLGKARVRHPKPAEGGDPRDSARFEQEFPFWRDA